jgi:CheY-like chemotaxis protein
MCNTGMSPTAILVTVTAATRNERRHLLEEAGFNVATAASFEEGCNLLRQVQPDLLVADVRLLDYNGLHLAMRARDESPRTRTVIVGDPDLVLERDAKALGARYVTSADLPAFVEAARDERASGDRARDGRSRDR